MRPGTVDQDLGNSKSFNLTEYAALHVEGCFVNVLNHVNLATPKMRITSIDDPSQGNYGLGFFQRCRGTNSLRVLARGKSGLASNSERLVPRPLSNKHISKDEIAFSLLAG